MYKVDGRAKPYAALLPQTKGEEGRDQPLLGYFVSYDEADAALTKAIAAGQLDKARLTLGDLWARFEAGEYFEALSKDGKVSHRSAWKHLGSKKDTRVRDIATDVFQDIIRA